MTAAAAKPLMKNVTSTSTIGHGNWIYIRTPRKTTKKRWEFFLPLSVYQFVICFFPIYLFDAISASRIIFTFLAFALVSPDRNSIGLQVLTRLPYVWCACTNNNVLNSRNRFTISLLLLVLRLQLHSDGDGDDDDETREQIHVNFWVWCRCNLFVNVTTIFQFTLRISHTHTRARDKYDTRKKKNG